MKSNFYREQKDKGYTLVEILVAVAVFSIAIAGPTGLFVSAVRNQQKMMSQQRAIDNLSYVIEYMSRSLRMAKKDDVEIDGLNVNCLSGSRVNYEVVDSPPEIIFRNHKNQCHRFYLQDGRLREEIEDSGGFIVRQSDLTPADLDVKELRFNVAGEGQYDNIQPRVTLAVGVAEAGDDDVFMRVQTSVSQRDLDITY